MKYTAHEHMAPHETIAPQTATDETIDGASFLKTQARESLVVASMSAVGTSFQINLQHSDDDITFVDFPGVSNVAGSGLSAVLTATGMYVGRVDLEGAKLYVRAQLIAIGAVVGYVTFINSFYKNLPVTQAKAILFNVQ